MANDINVVTLSGRLTRAAELKYTKSGTSVVSFSIASNTSQRMQDGSWGEYANYFDCTWYGKGAEALNPYLTKGRQVVVSGELRQRRWDDQNGASRTAVGIIVNDLTLCGEGRQKSTEGQPEKKHQDNSQHSKQPVSGPEEFDDDNIPF